jgi:ABC-type uncharacterized transport system YnjBCD ATPase subunit
VDRSLLSKLRHFDNISLILNSTVYSYKIFTILTPNVCGKTGLLVFISLSMQDFKTKRCSRFDADLVHTSAPADWPVYERPNDYRLLRW